MITRETDTYLDIYPFVDAVDELPSDRISVYKLRNEVIYHGNTYTREEFDELAAAFQMAFDAQKYYATTTEPERET